MFTFMEWVSAVETVQMAFSRYLAEAKSEESNMMRLARIAVLAVQDTIRKGNYSPAVKMAAQKMASSEELQPAKLAGKLGGLLKGIGAHDQEEIFQNGLLRFIMAFPKLIAKHHFGTDDTIDPDDFGSWISANIQGNRIGKPAAIAGAKMDHYRKMYSTKTKKIGRTVTDVSSGDEKRRPEPAYAPGGEDATINRPQMSGRVWNDAIRLVVKTQESIEQEINSIKKSQSDEAAERDRRKTLSPEEKRRLKANDEAAGKKQDRRSTALLSKQAEKLNVTLAIMRNLPAQMAQQLGMLDDDEDVTIGDNRIYKSLKSMVADETSDMQPQDRAILGKWVNETGKGDHEHRNIIATALWITTGMHANSKPRKALEDTHWFYDYALDIEDNDVPEAPTPAEAEDDFDDKPDITSKTTSAPAPTPIPEPEPAPSIPKGKPIQRGLFDDM